MRFLQVCLVSFFLILAVAEICNAQQTKPLKTSVQLPGYLQRIMEAPNIFTTIGYSAAPNQLGLDLAQAKEKGAAIDRQLHYAYDHGTPSAKLLTAEIIGSFDRKSGTKLLQSLAGNQTIIECNEGCIIERKTLGDLARKALQQMPDPADRDSAPAARR